MVKPGGTPDRSVDAELEVGDIHIGDVGLLFEGSAVSENNPLPTHEASVDTYVVSTVNSTTSTLGAGAAFTGEWESTDGVVALEISVQTSHASAASGAVIQYSKDGGSTILDQAANTIAATAANTATKFVLLPFGTHFRVVYTNGATPQTSFVLSIKKHSRLPINPQVPLGASFTDADTVPVSQGLVRGRSSSTSFPALLVDASGRIVAVGPAADGAAIAGNPIRIAGYDSTGATRSRLASPLGAGAVSLVAGRYFDPNAGEYITTKSAVGTASSSGDNVVLAAVSGKKITVLSYALQAQGTVNAVFQDNSSTTNRTLTWNFQAREGVSRVCSAGGLLFQTAEGVGLDLNLSAAVSVGWEIEYVEIE